MYNKCRVYLITLNASLGFGYWAYNFSIFNSLQDYMSKYVFPNASTTTISLIASFINIGSIIGGLIGGTLVSTFGRRRTLMGADVLGIIAIVLLLIQSLPVLLIGRILSGVVSGINIVAISMYLVEISPLPMCGATGSLTIIMSETFSFISLAMGFLIPSAPMGGATNHVWRILVAIAALLNIIRFLILKFVYKFETPTYLIQNGRKEEAVRTLKLIFTSNIQEEYKRVEDDVKASTVEGSIHFKDLLSKKYRKILFVDFILAFIQHFAGMTIIFVFSNDIFSRCSNNPVLFSTVLGVINLVGVILSFGLIDKFGRRTLIITGLFIITILWLSFGLTALLSGEKNSGLKFILLIWPLFFQMSTGSLTFLYISETLPSVGVAFCVAANWTSAFIISQFYLQVVKAFGIGKFFIFCAIVCFLAGLVFWKYLVETQGRTRSEIMAAYLQNSSKKYSRPSNESLEVKQKLEKEKTSVELPSVKNVSNQEDEEEEVN